LTITLKEKENTRSLLDGLDYSEYAEEISEKSYNARKASKECEALFHCLLLRDQGCKVFEALVFEVDINFITVYIHDLNMHCNIRLKEDKRIDQTTYFDDDLLVACNFKQPLILAEGVKNYKGAEELKKSNQQRIRDQFVLFAFTSFFAL
jgi:exoribonuclease R